MKKLNKFLSQYNKIKHFEIGTRMNFDFCKFFSNYVKILLNEVGKISQKVIQLIVDKINEKNAFAQAPKFEKERINISPGPAIYLNNIYNTESVEERINALIGKNRFTTKLFIDKKGPQMHKEHINKKKEDPVNKFRNKYFLENKKKLQQAAEYLIKPKKGFTFETGGHDFSGNGKKLLEERKRKANARNELYYSAFKNNMVFSEQNNQRYGSSISITTNNDDNRSLNKNSVQSLSSARILRSNNEEKFQNMVKKNKSKIFIEDSYKKRIILDKFKIEYNDEEKYKSKERYKDIIFWKNSIQLKRTDEKIEELRIKKEQEKDDAPMYDISRGLLDEKKGFTMLSRRIPTNNNINEAPYVYLKSDFDRCVERYNGISPKSNIVKLPKIK